jgi:hypothetical protein
LEGLWVESWIFSVYLQCWKKRKKKNSNGWGYLRIVGEAVGFRRSGILRLIVYWWIKFRDSVVVPSARVECPTAVFGLRRNVLEEQRTNNGWIVARLLTLTTHETTDCTATTALDFSGNNKYHLL